MSEIANEQIKISFKPVSDETEYVVVKRALVTLKIAKPGDISDEDFQESIDAIYVTLSEVLDARAIHARFDSVLAESTKTSDGYSLETAVEVL